MTRDQLAADSLSSIAWGSKPPLVHHAAAGVRCTRVGCASSGSKMWIALFHEARVATMVVALVILDDLMKETESLSGF